MHIGRRVRVQRLKFAHQFEDATPFRHDTPEEPVPEHLPGLFLVELTEERLNGDPGTLEDTLRLCIVVFVRHGFPEI